MWLSKYCNFALGSDNLKRLLVFIHPSCLGHLYPALQTSEANPCHLFVHWNVRWFSGERHVDSHVSFIFGYFHTALDKFFDLLKDLTGHFFQTEPFTIFTLITRKWWTKGAILANPSCIHATTPFVYKRSITFSIVKAKVLTSILAFEFLNGLASKCLYS